MPHPSASIPSSAVVSAPGGGPTLPAQPPLFERLSGAVLAFLGSRHALPEDDPPLGRVARYATFDAPTYQRRGLRIPGLGPAADGVTENGSAPIVIRGGAAPARGAVRPPGSPPRSARPTPPARRSVR